MLNDQYDDPKNPTGYWIYSINGQLAEFGIDDYLVNEGDLIEFNYAPVYADYKLNITC